MNALGKGSLVVGVALGLVVVAGLGWASAGAPGAPTWMHDTLGHGHMGTGHACHGCASGSGDTPAGVDVAIRDVSYDPPTLRVRVGDVVVWRNMDPFEHTVTSDEGRFDSGLLREGDEWRLRFTEPGTYRYHCIPHAMETSPGVWEGQVGTIIVE